MNAFEVTQGQLNIQPVLFGFFDLRSIKTEMV